MAHFNFTNDLKNLLLMDEPVKGPVPRWQKRVALLDKSSSNNASMNGSVSTNNTSSCNSSSMKTPNHKTVRKTGNGGSCKKSPAATTPAANKSAPGGDRFIPVRSSTNFDLGNYLLNKSSGVSTFGVGEENNEKEVENEGKDNQNHLLKETIMQQEGAVNGDFRILAYNNKAPAPPEGHLNPLRVVYSQTKNSTAGKQSTRYIPHSCERVLDAPDIIDDYYLNLIDWSPSNVVAVALANSVYLWNAESGAIKELLELEAGDYPSSVAWIQETVGNYVAIGTCTGTTQIWDCVAMKRLRTMAGHSARVGSLSWNQHILSSGSRSGRIIQHDVRQREHAIAQLSAHSEEVCGLRWCPDGRLLASGGNDNVVCVWDNTMNGGTTSPLHRMTEHQAAVKAVAWCPWRRGVLATGGGTADRMIRVWNVLPHAPDTLSTTDTRSQVCALQWSQHFRELISGHGYSQNQLTLWKFPQMSKVAELTGHTARILQLCISPDGTTVLSAAADETLRLWKCFVPDPTKPGTATSVSKTQPRSLLRTNTMR